MSKPSTAPTTLTKPNKLTKRQRKFVVAWCNPESETFGNAYQSALIAGYGDNQARVITGEAKGLQWVAEAKRLYAEQIAPEHIYQGVQHEALHAGASRDRLKAYEMLGKFNGMFIERSVSDVNVKFTNSVPRPFIPSEPIEEV